MLRCKLHHEYGAYYHPVASCSNMLYEVEVAFLLRATCCCNLQQGGNTLHIHGATCNVTLLYDQLRENVARITPP